MTIIVIGISFILIWLVTTFFIVRYIKRLKSDLQKMLSDKEKLSEKKDEYINDERVNKPFDYANRVDREHLLTFIQQEHPQIIALVLAHLKPYKASVILQNLPQDMQSDVARRIATMDRASPEIIREIERVLEKKLSTLSGEAYSKVGGVESIVEILNLSNRASEKQIIEQLEDEDPELAEVINDRLSALRKPCGKIWGKLKGKAKFA
jgi:flagellar motor switch protein FliG